MRKKKRHRSVTSRLMWRSRDSVHKTTLCSNFLHPRMFSVLQSTVLITKAAWQYCCTFLRPTISRRVDVGQAGCLVSALEKWEKEVGISRPVLVLARAALQRSWISAQPCLPCVMRGNKAEQQLCLLRLSPSLIMTAVLHSGVTWRTSVLFVSSMLCTQPQHAHSSRDFLQGNTQRRCGSDGASLPTLLFRLPRVLLAEIRLWSQSNCAMRPSWRFGDCKQRCSLLHPPVPRHHA